MRPTVAREKSTRRLDDHREQLAEHAAKCIERNYILCNQIFIRITRRARKRFEGRDWAGRHRDAIARLDAYERALTRLSRALAPILGERLTDTALWKRIKRHFRQRVIGRHDVELAETFYNSATRKMLHTVGIDRRLEFFFRSSHHKSAPDALVCRTYETAPTIAMTKALLSDTRFSIPFEDLDRDAERVAREIDLHTWPIVQFRKIDGLDMVRAPFFRNKVAYLVGRVRAHGHMIPLCIPLYNGAGGIYVDAALLTEAEVSRIFSFAFSYFHVLTDRHDALISFLTSILPEKPVAELYISIGYPKHGKTEFYRDLHRYIHVSKEKFIIAPGKEGTVMIAFTLEGYDFVFKLIKDRPCLLRSGDETSKRISRREVMAKYSWVCHSDRVGRMVDTQEFENLRFKLKRFSPPLLRELTAAAKDTVTIIDSHLVISHVYVQRRVIPLPMYLQSESDPELIRSVILDFGWFLKDLAASGIFPCDLFNIWNYGVTRRGRVVLYDYDDVEPLEKVRFLNKPAPRNHTEELLPEDERIACMPDDYFIDEIEKYSGLPQPLKGVFKSVHADLFTAEYWLDLQTRVKRGEIVDITPYDHRRRFKR